MSKKKLHTSSLGKVNEPFFTEMCSWESFVKDANQLEQSPSLGL